MAQLRECDRYACREQEKCSDMVNIVPDKRCKIASTFLELQGDLGIGGVGNKNRNFVPNCSRNILCEVHPCLKKKG